MSFRCDMARWRTSDLQKFMKAQGISDSDVQNFVGGGDPLRLPFGLSVSDASALLRGLLSMISPQPQSINSKKRSLTAVSDLSSELLSEPVTSTEAAVIMATCSEEIDELFQRR